MPKRKRTTSARKNVEASPQRDATGEQSVSFNETPRDSEWLYDEDHGEGKQENSKVEGPVEEEVVLDEWEDPWNNIVEDDDSLEQGIYRGIPVEEMEEDEEWDIEPQTEALAYLHSVRAEASALPSVAYIVQQPPQLNTIESPKGEELPTVQNGSPSDTDHSWQLQFLKYYNNLRETFASAPEPNLSQDELDELLHINPRNRPSTSDEEDRLWRLKTLDEPSVTLLSMLDHKRTIHLLTHLRKKISANAKVEQCLWLVFLLGRLGDPGVLSGDEIDLLRRIGRKCLSVRDSLDDGKHEVVSSTVDMVVCIIKYYYQQKDLEDTY